MLFPNPSFGLYNSENILDFPSKILDNFILFPFTFAYRNVSPAEGVLKKCVSGLAGAPTLQREAAAALERKWVHTLRSSWVYLKEWCRCYCLLAPCRLSCSPGKTTTRNEVGFFAALLQSFSAKSQALLSFSLLSIGPFKNWPGKFGSETLGSF